jgi:hypothetical protein
MTEAGATLICAMPSGAGSAFGRAPRCGPARAAYPPPLDADRLRRQARLPQRHRPRQLRARRAPHPSRPRPGHAYRAYSPRPPADARLDGIEVAGPQGALGRALPALWRQRGVVADLVRDRLDLFHGLSNELPTGIERTGVAPVVTIHDLIFERFPALYPAVDRAIYRLKFRSAATSSSATASPRHGSASCTRCATPPSGRRPTPPPRPRSAPSSGCPIPSCSRSAPSRRARTSSSR